MRFLQSDGRHKEVQSVEEMIKKNFTFFSSEISTFDFIKRGNQEVFQRLKPFEDDKDFFLTNPLKGDEKIAALEGLKAICFATYQKNFQIHFIKEPFMHINVVLYLQKNSYLTKSLNRKITQLLNGGIIQKWIKNHHSDKVQKYHESLKLKKLEKLSLLELSGAFYLLMFGNILGMIFFVFEILAHNL